MNFREIHFEDNGQDFLFWVLNENNVVVDSQPFMGRHWRGVRVNDIEIGKPLKFTRDEETYELNYKTTDIKMPEKEYDFWHDQAVA